jgi:L-lysine exporter family protein LysE/ArgO
MILDWVAAYTQGLAVMASLIIAIGVQNAFVLRQGLQGRAVFITASICFACDVLLIGLGAAGLSALFAASRSLSLLIAFGGAGFLGFYGVRSLRAAQAAKGLKLDEANRLSRTNVALTALAVSLLNPHAILDTVVLAGGLAARHQGIERIICAVGAMSASGVWFYGLAYGARWLAPVLSKPKVWRVIDLAIGLMMLALAAGLAWDGVQVLSNR